MRKMSSNSQGPSSEAQELKKKKEEELSKYQSKQKEIESEYQPMIQKLQDVEFKPSMLLPNDPQLKTFINLLKQLFGKILSNKGSASEEERKIIAECLNIWISLITYDPSRLVELYNDAAYLELFVVSGLLSENQMLR